LSFYLALLWVSVYSYMYEEESCSFYIGHTLHFMTIHPKEINIISTSFNGTI